MGYPESTVAHVAILEVAVTPELAGSSPVAPVKFLQIGMLIAC